MNRKRVLLNLLLALVLIAGTVGPVAAGHAGAQSEIALTVSVPDMWENTLTPDLLAEFEAQHSGVKVYLTLDDTAFFGFGPGSSTVDDQLDATEELVMSADVAYVSTSSLTTADTQAGYFLDLAPLVLNDPALDTADFIPAVWQSYQWDNGFWALPLSTDVIILTYDPAAFDAAGLAYPNERWTIDDFANAARLLTQYNADGTVATAGLSVVEGGNNLNVFLRALAGAGLYDAATMPNAPSFSNPALEHILQVGYEMVQDGVVVADGGGRFDEIPLRIEGVNGYTMRGFGPDQKTDTTVRYATLLPGGVAGLNVQGFAVSVGTQQPELAYELAKFLTNRPELASNFFSVSPARYSLVGQGNGLSGFGGVTISIGEGAEDSPLVPVRTIPAEIQPVVDQGLAFGLPMSELRYVSYLMAALNAMSTNGGDAISMLQTIEAKAISDVQTAQARYGTVSIFIEPPAAEPTLAPGEITLTCALNLGFMIRGAGGRMPNQEQWDQIIADFVAADPQVGAVNLEMVGDSDMATLAESYDCIIMNSNAVPDADLSAILNLDPLMDTDTSFDRNDVIGNTLAQLQRDNKTWALPLSIQPQMLQYNSELFALAGVPEPVNGWTAESFADALRLLKSYDPDSTPFEPNDPSGSYLLMLIAAYGGLPVDYRTDPPTVNFTDPTTVDAIRQVLSLITAGYINYTSLAAENVTFVGGEETPAITTYTLNAFSIRLGPPGAPEDVKTEQVNTTYPQGSQYGVIAYEITTGYISATAQNPEAAYRFLSQVARNPQLFSGMPARQSLVSDPAVIAAQGEEVAAVYQQLDALLRAPNTIVFPTFTTGKGGPASFLQSYWLNRAFDRVISEGADLETELADAELITRTYLECAAGVVVDTTSGDAGEQRRQLADQILACATAADPEFSIGG